MRWLCELAEVDTCSETMRGRGGLGIDAGYTGAVKTTKRTRAAVEEKSGAVRWVLIYLIRYIPAIGVSVHFST